MKEERLQILQKVANGELTPTEADRKLWDLFSVSCRIPYPKGKRIEYSQYYIKRYSQQYGLDKDQLEKFMTNFLGDEWMSDPDKSYS